MRFSFKSIIQSIQQIIFYVLVPFKIDLPENLQKVKLKTQGIFCSPSIHNSEKLNFHVIKSFKEPENDPNLAEMKSRNSNLISLT